MDRERVEQLVRDQDALEHRGKRIGRGREAPGDVAERVGLRAPRFIAGLHEVQAERVVESRIAVSCRTQDVGGQTAIAGAGFDEIEAPDRRGSRALDFLRVRRGLRGQGAHFSELDFQQLAEEGPDVDAGKKIARAAGSLGRTGVVAEVGVVERQIHERGHRHRAAFTDDIGDRRSAMFSLS